MVGYFGGMCFIVVRENTEGKYSSIGGWTFEGTDYEVVLQESVFTRRGVDRILRYAWDERAQAMAVQYPDVRADQYHIDILTAFCPESRQVRLGQIWSGAMMLEHWGHKEAGSAVMHAIETVLREGPHTRDISGQASTQELGNAIAGAL